MCLTLAQPTRLDTLAPPSGMKMVGWVLIQAQPVLTTVFPVAVRRQMEQIGSVCEVKIESALEGFVRESRRRTPRVAWPS